jgi:hypothetical protein
MTNDDNFADIFEVVFVFLVLIIFAIIGYNSQPLAKKNTSKEYREQLTQTIKESSITKECLEEDKIIDTGITSERRSTKKFIKLESGKIYVDDLLDNGYRILSSKKIGDKFCVKEKTTLTFFGDTEKTKKILSENNFDNRFINETKEEDGKLIYIDINYFPHYNNVESELNKLKEL